MTASNGPWLVRLAQNLDQTDQLVHCPAGRSSSTGPLTRRTAWLNRPKVGWRV